MNISEIRDAIHDAAHRQEKMAMFHYQVLRNASRLHGIDGEVFCDQVKVPKSYAIEYKKMLNLARMLKSQGVSLTTSL